MTHKIPELLLENKELREEVGRLTAELSRAKYHILRLETVAEDERSCKRCGLCFCDCVAGKL